LGSGVALVNGAHNGLTAAVYVHVFYGKVLFTLAAVASQCLYLCCERPQQAIGSVEMNLYASVRLPFNGRICLAIHSQVVDRHHLHGQHSFYTITWSNRMDLGRKKPVTFRGFKGVTCCEPRLEHEKRDEFRIVRPEYVIECRFGPRRSRDFLWRFARWLV